jgi:hypothetical protein
MLEQHCLPHYAWLRPLGILTLDRGPAACIPAMAQQSAPVELLLKGG